MEIVTTQSKHAVCLADYYTRNADRFQPWHPLVKSDHHSVSHWKRRLAEREREYQEGNSVHFIALENDRVIAACSLTNILYSPVCLCFMGYSVDREYEGSGVMMQLVRHVINYAFENLRLNRICANYMPANKRSGRLLEKLGFEKEGYAKRYLCINGQWEDHVLTALLNPDSSSVGP